MNKNITEIKLVEHIGPYVGELAELLAKVVEDDASVGFLPPLSLGAAGDYWENVLRPDVRLWAAVRDGRVAGTVQLHLCDKQNGRHRAEIAKLMTHPESRRSGVARALMHAAEDAATSEGRTLVVLDTREGDPSNLLYRSMGYRHAGTIPFYARSASGSLDATVLYYKLLGTES